MTDETIQRIIDAFEANRKSVVRRAIYGNLVTHLCFAERSGLISALAKKDGGRRYTWFIDGVEVVDDERKDKQPKGATNV